MELRELDCPFCDAISNWIVDGIEFIQSEVYMQTKCPKCQRTAVVSIPVDFTKMRMFVTPRSKSVSANMLPQEQTQRQMTEKELDI